jgi:hypothetical protein
MLFGFTEFLFGFLSKSPALRACSKTLHECLWDDCRDAFKSPESSTRMLLAGIQKKKLDARLHGYDDWQLYTQFCGDALSFGRRD